MTTVPAGEIGNAIENGARALLRRQRPDGAFGDNPPASVLGTAGTVAALHAADPDGSADLVAGGLSWLREHQHDDGGWGGVDGAGSEIVATAVAVAALAMTGPGGSAGSASADPASADPASADAIPADAITADTATADAITAGRACLARLGGVDAVTDPAIALLCRQLLTMAGLTAEAGRLRRLPLEIVFFDRVRRQRVSFRTAPFIGLALMQAGLLLARCGGRRCGAPGPGRWHCCGRSTTMRDAPVRSARTRGPPPWCCSAWPGRARPRTWPAPSPAGSAARSVPTAPGMR